MPTQMEEAFLNYYTQTKMLMLKKIAISCTILFTLTGTNAVMADTVFTTGFPLRADLPSSDLLSLLSLNLNLTVTDTPSTIDLQTGIYNADLSLIPDQNSSLIVNQDTTTIAGLTHSTAFSSDVLITSASDRPNQRPGEVTRFDDVNYAHTENMDIPEPGAKNFSVQTHVVTSPEPETYGMILVGLGLLGFSVRSRKKPPNNP